jgi:hypothetical protein
VAAVGHGVLTLPGALVGQVEAVMAVKVLVQQVLLELQILVAVAVVEGKILLVE